MNSYPMTVIGVAEPGFTGMDIGEAAAVWVPAMMKRQATPDWDRDRLFDRRTRWMHGVTPMHAPTIAAATIGLAGVVLCSAMLPAWRASSVSPTEALHAE